MDRDFIDDMDRAARALRAAVVSALTQGVSEDDVHRIVDDGFDAAFDLALTARSQERGRRIGHHPSGDPLPPPPLDAVADQITDGFSMFPRVHPGLGPPRRHAA